MRRKQKQRAKFEKETKATADALAAYLAKGGKITVAATPEWEPYPEPRPIHGGRWWRPRQ